MDLVSLLTKPQAYANAVEAELRRIAQDDSGRTPGLTELRRLYAVFDDNFTIPAGRVTGIACQKGCSWCCSLRITATAAEILLLADGLRGLPAEVRAEMAGRIAAAHQANAGLDYDGRRHRGVPCPLLLADGSCGVYRARPLSCRSLISFNARACETAMREDGVEVPLSGAHLQSKSILMLSLMGALKRRGLAWWQYELVHGLHLAMTHDDPLAAWLAGGDPLAAAREPLDSLYAQV
jgi:Fe-S-cluster containining protein